MHALRRYVQQGMDAKGWTPADLVRESGISKQTVSHLLKDDREIMASIPGRRTIAGIAKAFNVSESVVISYVIEALGYDLNVVRTEVDVSSLNDSELLNELGARLAARRKGQDLVRPDLVDLGYVTSEGSHVIVEIKDTSAKVHQLRDPVKELERLDQESHALAARRGAIDHGEAGDMSGVGEESQEVDDVDS